MAEDHAPPASEDGAPLRVNNPRSIRALAHPARLAIINALATGDELTATQCAELTELSPSATAYHLKLLERYGFAEPAPPRADRRERPWRASGRRTTVDLDSSTPAGASAASAVAAAYFDTTRAVALEFTAAEYAEPEEWWNDRGRDRRCQQPPAQIPACASTHWAPPLGFGVKALVGPGMLDAGFG
jgi:Helix-turn-helix domain